MSGPRSSAIMQEIWTSWMSWRKVARYYHDYPWHATMLDYSGRAIVAGGWTRFWRTKSPAQVLTDKDLIVAAVWRETSIFTLAKKLGELTLPSLDQSFIWRRRGASHVSKIRKSLVIMELGFVHSLSGASKCIFHPCVCSSHDWYSTLLVIISHLCHFSLIKNSSARC